jgi:hypothetical protein
VTSGPELFAAVPLRSHGSPDVWVGVVVDYDRGELTARVDVYGQTVEASVPASGKGMLVGDQVSGTWTGGTVAIISNNSRHPLPSYTTESAMGTSRALTTQAPAAVSGSALGGVGGSALGTVGGGSLGGIGGSYLQNTNPFIPSYLGFVYFPGAYSPNDQTIADFFNMITTRMNHLIDTCNTFWNQLNTMTARANGTLDTVNAIAPRVNDIHNNVNNVVPRVNAIHDGVNNNIVPRVNSVHSQGNSMVSAVSNTQGVLSTVVGDLAVQEVTDRTLV